MTLPRLRITMRRMIVIVVALAFWLAYVVHRARVQYLAVEAIQRTGGRVVYDWPPRLRDGTLDRHSLPIRSRWLVEWFGCDLFGNVTSVALGKKDADAVMVHVAKLDHLERLSFASDTCRLTDAGLLHLKGHGSLRYIYVRGSGITDVGLTHLSDLTGLRLLSLHGTAVSEGGIKRLKAAVPAVQVGLW